MESYGRSWATKLLVMGLVLMGLGGCARQTTSFVHPGVDFSFIRRVAVFPFQNLSDVVQAGPRVQSIFTAKLLETGGLEVVGPGETMNTLMRQNISLSGDPTPTQMILLGNKLSAQAIFFGVIEDYGVDRVSRNPARTVTATFRLVETETGTVIWNCQVSVGGTSIWHKLFGGGIPSSYAVSEKAVSQALETLF